MLKILILLLVFSLESVYSRVIQYEADSKVPGCNVNITGGLGEPQPLFLIPGTESFLVPNASGILRLESGQTVEIVCVGSKFNISEMPWWWRVSGTDSVDSVIATCIQDTSFDLPWGKSNINTARCVSYPRYDATRTGVHCGKPDSQNELIEIGFRLSQTRFLHLLDVCHDSDLAATRYSYHKMIPANAGYQHSFPRPDFSPAGFYDFPVNEAYKRKSQKKMIGEILNSTKLGGKYIHDKNDYFMARGHLAAKADFIFGSHQRGTFYYLNTAPQWQTFNGGNWERVETSVRKFVANRGIEVDLYTGTHGVMTLPNEQGQHMEIYLNFDENANPRLPVPKIYYRVIHERKTDLGVVLIGVNNPYATEDEIKKNYVFCTDIIEKLDWLDLKPKNRKQGYTYACEFSEFSKVVQDLPKLVVKGLLY